MRLVKNEIFPVAVMMMTLHGVRDKFARLFLSLLDNDFRSPDDVHTVLRGAKALALQVVDGGGG